MGGRDANEILRTEGPEALRKAFDASWAKAPPETDVVARLAEGVAELRGLPRGDRVNHAPKIAQRMGGSVARGLIDTHHVINAIFQACDINNSDFRASIASALHTSVMACSSARVERPLRIDGAVPQLTDNIEIFETNDAPSSAVPEVDIRMREEAKESDAEVSRLAKLTNSDYERERKSAAKRLDMRVTVLDEMVQKRQKAQLLAARPLFPHWQVEPWPHEVHGSTLIPDVISCIRRYVAMGSEAAIAVALWIVMTWVHERAATYSPILLVTSAEANSGKSTLLGVVGFLAHRSLLSVSISAAALYRSVEKWKPTLVIDEADTEFSRNDDLRAVVNSGWTRGQGVVRCEGDTNEPTLFSTFCPKAIGLKGRKLPDTTFSRSIVIELKRKRPCEVVQDFRHADDDHFIELRRKLARWANDNADRLSLAKPAMPDGFINRVGANWKLLFAIADLAGGEWSKDARGAAGAVVGATTEQSVGIMLLSDAWNAFSQKKVERLFTEDIVAHLISLEERNWSELRGRPITKAWLSRKLGNLGVRSGPIRLSDGRTGKGYYKTSFVDAVERYLPSSGSLAEDTPS
jgi:putative DNA primase/helicase